MKNYIWVVEIQDDVSLKFEPTVGVGLTRKDGRDEKWKWETANPDDKFRLKKYVAERRKGMTKEENKCLTCSFYTKETRRCSVGDMTLEKKEKVIECKSYRDKTTTWNNDKTGIKWEGCITIGRKPKLTIQYNKED